MTKSQNPTNSQNPNPNKPFDIRERTFEFALRILDIARTICFLFFLMVPMVVAAAGEEIELSDGTTVAGEVKEVTRDGILMWSEGVEFNIPWSFLKPGKACEVWRAHLSKDDAEGHFQLAIFCLENEFTKEAAEEFGIAVAIDVSYRDKARGAWVNAFKPQLEGALSGAREGRHQEAIAALTGLKESCETEVLDSLLAESSLKDVAGMEKFIEELHARRMEALGYVEYKGRWIRKAEWEKIQKRMKTAEERGKQAEKERALSEVIEETKKRIFGEKAVRVKVLETDHYRVFSDGSVSDKFCENMEKLYTTLKKYFPFEEKESDELLPIYMFRTRSQYDDFAAGRGIPRNATAGFAFGDFYATYYQSPNSTVNYHEGAHQLVGNRLRILGGGSWFQEGMAVFMEEVMGTGKYHGVARSLIKSERAMPLRKFFALPMLAFSGDPNLDARDLYIEAGSIINFLYNGKYKEKLNDFLGAMRENKPGAEAIEKTIGVSVEEFEKEWKGFYLR